MSAPALIRGYEVVIGIETHAQLSTRSKIFSDRRRMSTCPFVIGSKVPG